ncbi:fibronectin type III domain-containing protein [Hymenobacter properus]|uniref:Fibronectin type III domain-containing protein n=1 Tax=Hymenobacter properus TaxID=2791026 RepID=A0A931BGV7_9BACT|nr:fibronectin type III domain-containing protein [Hymenobacter properus]MBF9142163.1 fibronectin type III domain-containing protein [Hymenobacter properus]MBR7720970.1 fibronectin type III domain-containing protein [Microvirga sp. SRT04]
MKQMIRLLLQRLPLVWTFLLLLSGGRALAQVSNDDCSGAVPLATSSVCTTPVNGTVAGATQSLAPTASCGVGLTTATDVWYSFTATSSLHLVTLAPRFAAILDVRSGSCASSSSVYCTTIANNNTAAVSVGGLVANQTYFVRIYPASNTPPTGISSTFALCIGQGTTGPTNDDCAGAIDIPVSTTGTCTTQVSADNTLATSSAGVPQPTCANYNGRDLWFSVTVPASGNVTVRTVVSTTGTDVGDTGMSIYSGTCGSLTQLGCSDDEGGGTKSMLAYTGRTPGEVLYVRVWSWNNNRSGYIALCATSPPPLANDDCAGAVPVPVTTACTAPVSGTIQGATQSLPPTANCGGSTAANDVWYSFVASGATQLVTLTAGFSALVDVRSGTCASSTSVFCGTAFNAQPLTVSGLTNGQTYYLRLYLNGTFTPANPAFTLCINPGPTPPANDECTGAVAVSVGASCSAPVSGTLVGASQSLPSTANCTLSATVVNDVWYSFVANGTSQTLAVAGNFRAVLDVRTGTCANSTSVFCTSTFGGQSVTATGLVNGQAYFLRVYADAITPPTNSAFTLCITSGPPPSVNDDCSTAVAVAVVAGCATSTNGTVANATQSLPPTANCGANVTTAADVWYSFVASAPTQLITLTTRFGAVMDIRSGNCTSSTSLLCTNVFAGSTSGTVVGGLTTNQQYYIRIYANGATQPLPANATFTLCISPAPTPPANDECANAVAVPVTTTCASPVSGTVDAASQSLAPASCNSANTPIAQDVWYSFVASGSSQLITINSRFTAVVEVRSGTCAASTSVTCYTTLATVTVGTLVGNLTNGQTYFLRVYAAGTAQPTAINATFTLCISPGPPPPANDECANAVPVTASTTTSCGTSVSGTVENASQSLPGTAGCGGGSGSAGDVWYSFVASSSAHTVLLTPTQGILTFEVRSGTCAASSNLSCNTVFTNGTQPVTVSGLTNGQTYFIRVYSTALTPPTGTAAGFTLCLSTPPPPPANDDCAGALTLPVQVGTTCTSQTTTDNTTATASTGAPAPGCAGNTQSRDVWFQVTVPATGTLTVRTVVPTTGTDVGDTGMAIYSGTCSNLSLLGCSDDEGGALKSLLTLNGRTPGEVLYVRVWAFNVNAVGTYAVCATTPQVCAAPTALASSNVTNNTAQLNWQPGGTPAAGTTYTVEYGVQGFTPGTGTTVTGLTTASTQLTALTPATTYCFYVRQNCPGGNGSSTQVGPTCFTTAAPVCAAPTAPASSNITTTTAQVSWQPGGTPATGTTYTLEYGVQGFTPGTGTFLGGLTSASAQLTALSPGTTYCFIVRQNCPGGNGSSTQVGPTCFTTTALPCAVPTGGTGAGSLNSAVLSWQPGGTPAAGTTYTVEFGPQGFTQGTGTTVTALSTTLTITGLTAATQYCFYVRQNCPAPSGSSAFAGPFCFQTTATPPAPANDDPCGAVTLTLSASGGPLQPVSGTTVGATTSAQPGISLPACAPATAPGDVWFSMTPAAGITSVRLTLTGAPAGMVRVFTAANCTSGPFTLVSCQSSGAANTTVGTVNLTGLTAGQRYYVAVSGYGNSDTPGAFTIAGATVTAGRVQAESGSLLVFPNPSNTGQLTLRLRGLRGTMQATLLNALGQVVYTQRLPSGTTEQVLNTRGFATGLYTLRVVVGDEVLTRKVVLE